MIFLPEGKTYFIMKDGSALPYYKAVLDLIPKIYVYNRRSLKGVECLKLRKMKSVIVEGTEEYEERTKKFLAFINNDLKYHPVLNEVISLIWNGEELHNLLWENDELFPECYAEEYDKYLTNLKLKYDDTDFLSYFYEKYCLQEFFWPRYSEEWLNAFEGPEQTKSINLDDLNNITLDE